MLILVQLGNYREHFLSQQQVHQYRYFLQILLHLVESVQRDAMVAASVFTTSHKPPVLTLYCSTIFFLLILQHFLFSIFCSNGSVEASNITEVNQFLMLVLPFPMLNRGLNVLQHLLLIVLLRQPS